MAIHLPACRCRVAGNIRMGIQLREKLVQVAHTGSKHKGLVAVITRTPVALPERFGHCQLRYLFAVAEYAKFSFPGQHFPPAQNTGLATFKSNPIVVYNYLLKVIKTEFGGIESAGNVRGCFRHILFCYGSKIIKFYFVFIILNTQNRVFNQ